MVDIIDISSMTINQMNNEIKRLNNELDYYLNEKQRIFDKTQPKAGNMSGERVQGGTTREDRFANYVIECDSEEYQQIETKIDDTQNKIFNLTRLVERELRRIGEYDPLMKKIVELRETTKLSWDKIGEATGYCGKQCWRIYKKYKEQRNV